MFLSEWWILHSEFFSNKLNVDYYFVVDVLEFVSEIALTVALPAY